MLVVSLRSLTAWWGINHLSWLSPLWVWVFAALGAVIAVVLLWPRPVPRLENLLERVAHALSGHGWWLRGVMALAFAAVCGLLLMPTHFLGDGYEWLGNFGRGDSYIHKWSEPLSSLFVRWLQALWGEYTSESAQRAFRVLSVVSGVAAVCLLPGLTSRLFDRAHTRLVALATLLFSGVVLFYFGYVEFYPVAWISILFYLYLAAGSIRTRTHFWAVALAFLFALAMHVEALVLAGGLAFLIVQAAPRGNLRRLAVAVIALTALACLGGAVYLYETRIDIRVLILPLLKGRPPADDYTIIAPVHWFDLLQLALLVFPGVVALLALSVFRNRVRGGDPISHFLAWSSVGSVAFLVLFGAATTMARDWDVMALGLLPPLLWLLRRIDRSPRPLPANVVFGYALLCGLVTAAFLGVELQTQPAIARYQSLLTDRHRSAWITLATYFEEHGERAQMDTLMRRVDQLFPEYVQLEQAYRYLDQGDITSAQRIAEQLVARDPYRSDFLQLLGNVYGMRQRYAEAEKLYRDAILLRPYYADLKNEYAQLLLGQGKTKAALEMFKQAHRDDLAATHITEGLGLAYFRMGLLETAVAVADTLFAADPNSPGAHLLMMVIALQSGDRDGAKRHLQEYLAHGQTRSDYAKIRDHYGYLLH